MSPVSPFPGRKSGFLNLRLLVVLTVVGLAAYYYGGHQNEVHQYVEQKAPRVGKFLGNAGEQGQELFQKTAQRTQTVANRVFFQKDQVQRVAGPVQRSSGRPAAVTPRKSSAGEQVHSRLSFPSTKDLPSGIRICSFNIRIFSDNSRSEEELNEITDILKQYDMIAIQELRDERVLQRAVRQLARKGHHFAYEISPPVGREVKERYAFLFRKDRVQLKTKGKIYQKVPGEFIRDPYYAEFQSGQFDFILLTVHLLYGDNKDQRRKELAALATAYKAVQLDNPQEQDIILLGDFNLPPTDDGWRYLKLLPTMTYLIAPPEKTTISDTSLYDNLWFQTRAVKEYSGRSGVNRFDEDRFHQDDYAARMAVSDHRPIWAEFRTDLPDTD